MSTFASARRVDKPQIAIEKCRLAAPPPGPKTSSEVPVVTPPIQSPTRITAAMVYQCVAFGVATQPALESPYSLPKRRKSFSEMDRTGQTDERWLEASDRAQSTL